MNVGCNYLREHMIDAARIHYAYSDPGGTAPNVVQSHAVIKYEVRAPKVSQVQELFTLCGRRGASGAALMTGTKMNYEITMAFSDYVPEPHARCLWWTECLRELGAPDWTDADDQSGARSCSAPIPAPRIAWASARSWPSYFAPERPGIAALEKPLDRLVHPFNPRRRATTPAGHGCRRRGLRHADGHVQRRDGLPWKRRPLVAEYGLRRFRDRQEGHAPRGGGADARRGAHDGAAGGYCQGAGGAEAETAQRIRPLHYVTPPIGRY